MGVSHKPRREVSLKAAMMPICVLALLNAVICWTAAWAFRDRFEFSATLLGLGCLPIVVAVCAYLYLLTKASVR